VSRPLPHPYASALYVGALGHIGRPIDVPEWSTPVLARDVPGGGKDAIGPYPMTTMAADADLEGGLARLAGAGLVSLVLVADPLSGPRPEQLAAVFPLCRPFKTHYLIEGAATPSKHHRDRIRRGLRRCRIETVALADHLDGWAGLYAGLVERRTIGGAADFTPAYFQALAREPRLVAFAAYVGGDLAGMTLWFAHAGVVYNHLTASNAIGYANGANFALYDAAIAHFAGSGVINLGGGAGFRDNPDDGLAAFKRGFANGETRAHLCGAVLDPARYADLSAGRPSTGFFPAYRG
jgi:hypothetical protein